MMSRRSHLIACLLLLWPAGETISAAPQTRDTIVSRYVGLVMDGKVDSVLPHLDDLRRIRAGSPGLLFLEGLVANEPEQSIQFFLEVANQYPKSEWADDALVRLHDYYRALGRDSLARFTLRRLRTEYPLSPYLRIGYLPQDAAGHRRPEGEEFAIQIGAFANRENAIRLRDTLAGRSYSVDIFENFIDGKRLYYLVWVGTFKTMAEAEKEAERMRSVDRIFGVVRQRNMAR
jgi:hypothetical protein